MKATAQTLSSSSNVLAQPSSQAPEPASEAADDPIPNVGQLFKGPGRTKRKAERAPLPVGERLVEMGAITRDQLHIALHEQKRQGALLGSLLVELGFLDEATLTGVLADRTGLVAVELGQIEPDSEILNRWPKNLAQRHLVLPLRLSQNRLDVAMADPYDLVAMDALRRRFSRSVELVPHVARKADLENAISRTYGCASASLDDALRELETGQELVAQPQDETAQHPVVQLVNRILIDAVRKGASDVHLEPENTFVRVRYRVDGALKQMRALHREHWPALSHRIKIMAGMNIADTRSIQDGRFYLRIGEDDVDFRVAIMPTVWGENIVVRVLDHRRALVPLSELGFHDGFLATLERVLDRPMGITLVTGPTGSGKTTTLYALLRRLSSQAVNIATLEEPVEYQLGLIRQTAIQESQGLTFAAGVRGVLRMDPDIIFVGEVRDKDTAQMALRAAMTGHQVFTTLHCPDALSALPRLVDLDLHPRILAGNISAVLAQRLVRKLCPHCRYERQATQAERRLLALPEEEAGAAERESQRLTRIFDAKGCARCDGAGRKGRTAIAEILRVTPAIDEALANNEARSALLALARTDGFRTLREDALDRVREGEIALEDARRVIDMTREE